MLTARIRFFCLTLCALVFVLPLVAQQAERPKLVIGLVVDQMRWDYLYRYQYRFGKDGFRRLLSEGFSYENASIPYTPAVTSAGHAAIYTGSVPAFHGIVGNDWIERRTESKMYCTRDTLVSSVGSTNANGRMSPRNLLSPTIGDQLRLDGNFRNRVFGIALKDRGGIIPAGHSANAAYWIDDSTGNWISSTWYMQHLPSWVDAFNRRRVADSFMRNDWTLLYPESTYLQSTADDNQYEKTVNHEKKVTFPHEYASQIGKNYLPLRQSPFGNTLTLRFAQELTLREGLGRQGFTDMLCISLSSTDYVAHQFGTHSLETEDMYIRLDRDIAAFLRFLDAYAGKNNYLLFMTADHGSAHVPAFLKDNRIPAGHLKNSDLTAAINAHMENKTGLKGVVRGIIEYQVYLDRPRLDSVKADIESVSKEVISYLNSRDEVMMAFSYSDMDDLVLPAEVKEKFIRGYFAKRSGDIQYFLKPYYSDVLSKGVEHGSWYSYDAHIPMVWFGWKTRPGKSHRKVLMTDIAPTLAAMLRIQEPAASVGEVLQEHMR